MENFPGLLNKKFANLVQAQIQQLEQQSHGLKLMLNRLSSQFNQLSSSVIATKQQLRSFKQDLKFTEKKIEKVKTEFSEETILDLCRIKNPNTTLVKLSEKFLLLINESDKNWPSFKKLAKNAESLKQRINKVSFETLPKDFFSSSLVVLQDYSGILMKLKNYPRAVFVLSELIKVFLEYQLKKEAFEVGVKDHLKYRKKVVKTRGKVSQVTMQVVVIEEKLRQLKENVGKLDESKNSEYETGDNSLTIPFFNKVANGHKTVFEKTASRGIMKNSEFRESMPDIREQQDGYFMPENRQDDEYSLFIDLHEKLGCCKSNYFCF